MNYRFGSILFEDDPKGRCQKCGLLLINVTIDNNGTIIPTVKEFGVFTTVFLYCKQCQAFRIADHNDKRKST